MKVLYLSHKNPVPRDEGAKIVIGDTLRALARRCDLTLLYLDWEGAGASEELKKLCKEVIPVRHSLPPFPKAALDVLKGRPYPVLMFENRRFRKILTDLVQKRRFDVVHMETPFLYQYRDCIGSLPLVLRQHNLEGLLLDHRAERMENPLRKYLTRWQARRFIAHEIKAIHGSDVVVSITETDRENMESLYRCRGSITTIPPGMVVNGLPASEEEHCLVFTGRMDWTPNIEGMLWFVKEVFPSVTERFPKLKLYIVGGNPPASVRSLEDDRIRVMGRVDDVRIYIDRAQVYIVPIRVGSGIRLKILEAMARGKPVVSTYKGAEGILCKSGEDILLADGPEEFAEAVIRCLEDQDLRKRLGRNAYLNIKQNYSLERIGDEFIKVYKEAIKNHGTLH